MKAVRVLLPSRWGLLLSSALRGFFAAGKNRTDTLGKKCASKKKTYPINLGEQPGNSAFYIHAEQKWDVRRSGLRRSPSFCNINYCPYALNNQKEKKPSWVRVWKKMATCGVMENGWRNIFPIWKLTLRCGTDAKELYATLNFPCSP